MSEQDDKGQPDQGEHISITDEGAPPRANPPPASRGPKTELGIPVPNLPTLRPSKPSPLSSTPRPERAASKTMTFAAPTITPMVTKPAPELEPAPGITSETPEAAPANDGRDATAPDSPAPALDSAPALEPPTGLAAVGHVEPGAAVPPARSSMPSAIDLPSVSEVKAQYDTEELDDRPRRPKPSSPRQVRTLDEAREVAETLRARMRHDVMGRDDVIEMVLVALFGDGHILLEDYPGSGKTTLAKALGQSIIADSEGVPEASRIAEFRRIQFTPDLLPSDVTGVMIFDTEANRFEFRQGPVFAYVVLVDEINRTSPKVQAALLESMAEKQVTVDNISHALDELFFVIATQNPLDSVGTYPLPLAQLDRFLFKIRMDHVDRASELEVLSAWGTPRTKTVLPRVTRNQIVQARELIRESVSVSPKLHECLVDLARNLRADKRCMQGVSTRSLVQAIPALQILAVLRGRDFVSGEDIEHLAVPLFQHRLALAPGVESAEPVIAAALKGPLESLTRGTLKR